MSLTGPYGAFLGYLGEGRYARPVPEVRYDTQGTAIHYEKPGRYRGLPAHEASLLSDALYYDLPGSPCLLTLRKRWAERATDEQWEEPTTVDAGVFYDWGVVAARNYNEDL